MVGKELESGTVDCRFPNVRKTYWRSATWSAPPSPKLHPFALEHDAGVAEPNALPQTPRSQEVNSQNTKYRAPLPPLQPLSIVRKNPDEWPSAGLDDVGGDWPVPATPGCRKAKTGLDIKLDLASIQRTAAEPTEIQLKRDKFAHFDKQCSRVANYHIYLGSDAVARDREALRANGITHVLNCVGFVCPEYFKQELNYKTLWLQDSPCEDITSLLYDVFDYFEDVREQGGRVFVHCCQGVSRSTSLVIAYLMWRERSSFEDAFQDVKAARGVTNPNMGFACQLLQCQKRVHAMPMSPNSVLRMYRLAPHSPYDPLHLVPKALSNPGAGYLDSRGAFVIQLPYKIIVWIGQDCDVKIGQAAKEAADQVVRYERAEGPVQVLPEGRESLEFWELLSKYSVSEFEGSSGCVESDPNIEKQVKVEVERVRQLGVGNRKVLSYDSDYDLYRIARQGGVIPPVPFSGVGVATVPTRIPAREDGWSVLRRKYLSGKLLSVKEVVSNEKPKLVDLSPGTLGASSSPHLSPLSSSSAAAGSDSPFASPVSHLGDLSPRTPFTPFATPVAHFGNPLPGTPQTPYATPVSHLRNLSPDASQNPSSSASFPFRHSSSRSHHLYINSLHIPSSVKSLGTKKGLGTASLAQRRGSVAPTLEVPGLLNDPPPAPRGMSRKPKLPPLVTTEKYWVEQLCEETHTGSFKLDALREMCDELVGIESQKPEQLQEPSPTTLSPASSERKMGDVELRSDPWHESSTKKAVSEDGHVFLYLWPGFEKIDMFEADDLDTTAAFVLVALVSHSRRHKQCAKAFVWVGSQVTVNRAQQTNSERDEFWHQAGQDFLERLQLSADVPIRVVYEGHECEEFWETFNQE